MKIKSVRKELIQFADIKEGCCFRTASLNILCIKVKPKVPIAPRMNAVSLADGEAYHIQDGIFVYPVDAVVKEL